MNKNISGSLVYTMPDDYTVIDFETTGLSPQSCEIIEIGAAKVRAGEIVECYSTLLKPRGRLDPYITELTGITDFMLKNAPCIADILPEFVDFIGSDIILGHNVTFDLGFLKAACTNILCLELNNNYTDTMRISRKLFPEEKHHKLSDLEHRFGLRNPNAHRAMADVYTTHSAYMWMKHYIKENGIEL